MNAETTLDRVMIALGIKSKESEAININLEQVKTLDGQATFDAEVFEVGSPIFVVTPDGNIPAPQGEFAMEDGTIVTVDEKGYIAEISSAEEEMVEEEVEMQNAPMKEATGKPTAEMPPVDMTAKPKKLTESVIKTTEFSAEVSDLKNEFEALKLKLSSLTDENAELKGRLASEEAPRTYHSPEKGNVNSIQFKLGEKRAETTTDRVFKQLFK
jgi:H2-forming N5,N10-methylenetetrahydromethanopterin dehydrogenase-like enzyme